MHQISLSIELDKIGFKKWEWFCKDFENKNAFPRAVEEFLSIKDELKPRVLYRGYNQKIGRLLEFKFEDLQERT